jgi:hypothetical protein
MLEYEIYFLTMIHIHRANFYLTFSLNKFFALTVWNHFVYLITVGIFVHFYPFLPFVYDCYMLWLFDFHLFLTFAMFLLHKVYKGWMQGAQRLRFFIADMWRAWWHHLAIKISVFINLCTPCIQSYHHPCEFYCTNCAHPRHGLSNPWSTLLLN